MKLENLTSYFMASRRSLQTWLEQVPFSEQLLDKCVKEDDIKEVFPSLMKVSIHWYAVGVVLGVPMHKLDEIRSNYHDTGTLTMLAQMIHYWIHNADSPTWRSLIEVLHKQGHKSAVSAVISDAERVVLGQCESGEQQLKYDSSEARNQVVSMNECKLEILTVVQREKKLFEKLCDLLKIPIDDCSDETLLDNINQHILSNPFLTRDQVKEVVLTINLISEESKRRSMILKKHVVELEKDLQSSGEIRAQLLLTKQDLQEQLSHLHEELEHMKSACVQAPSHSSNMEKLLKSMAEKEVILRKVKSQLKKCVNELQFANCNYEALSESLSMCVVLLKKALRQNEQLRIIATSCRKLTEAYFEPSRVVVFLGFFVNYLIIEGIFQDGNRSEFKYLGLILNIVMCAFIIWILDVILKYVFQHPLSHGSVSKILSKVISLGGKCVSSFVGIFIVMNPASTVLDAVRMLCFGFMSVFVFSRMYRPTHILTHRLIMLALIHIEVVIVASFLNRNNDGSFREAEPSSLVVSLVLGIICGFFTTILIFQHDAVQSGQIEDPLQWDIPFVLVGVVVSFCSGWAITQARAAYRLTSATGDLAGTFLGVTCFDKKIFFKPPPENNILDVAVNIFMDSGKILAIASNKIKELQTELIKMEHPYGSRYLPESGQSGPVTHRLSRSISHDKDVLDYTHEN